MEMVYALFIKLEPPVPGSATEKLIKLIENYTHHPKDKTFQVIAFSPQKWYSDKDLLVLFKKVRGQIEHSMETDRKRIKEMRGPSGRAMSREDQEVRLQDAKNDRLDDLMEFKKLIPELALDYKKRLNAALDKLKPLDREKLKSSPEFSWAENSSAFITRAQDTLLLDEEMKKINEFKLLGGTEFELEKRETAKPEEKQTGGEMVPFAKYHEVELELKMAKHEIKTIAEKFKDMPIPEAGESPAKPQEKKNASELESTIEIMAAEVYKYLSDEKKKSLIDKYLKHKGGELPGYGAPSEIEWAVSDTEFQKVIEKAESERDILDSKRREPVAEKEKNRLNDLFNGKIEELRLLHEIEKNRNHRSTLVERSKKEWNKSEAQGTLMESEEGLKKLEGQFSETVKEFNKWMEERISKSSEDEKEELFDLKHRVDQDASKSIRPITSEKFIQVQYGNILVNALEWFKKLHGLYRGASLSQNKSKFRVEEKNMDERKKEYLMVKKADAEKTPLESEYRSVSRLRDRSYDNLKKFVNNDIHSLESPYADADNAIKSLREFSSACREYLKNLEKEGQKIDLYHIQGVKNPDSENVKEAGIEIIFSAIKKVSDELGEKAVVKDFDKIFPEEQTLAKLKGIEHYDWAEEELGEIYDFFKKEYINPSAKLKSNAGEAGEDPRDLMKKYLDAVLEVFVRTWAKVNESKEDNSYWVMKKYPNLFKEILNLQRGGVFPKLSMSKIKPISKGIASRKSVIDYIEKNWLNSTPSAFKDAMKKWDHLFENPFKEEGGGGGSASKGKVTHSKEPKPIVNGTEEQIDRELVDFLKTDKTPEAFIKELIFNIGKGLRKESDADKIIDVGTVATSIAGILSDLPKMMRNLWIQVPGVSDRTIRGETSKEVEKMKKRAPQFAPGAKPEGEEVPVQYKTMLEPGPWRHRRNRPDIILTGKPEDQLKDAMKIFEKVRKLYRIIGFYLGRGNTKVEDTMRDAGFPDGLLEGIEHLNRILRKGPHAPEVGERRIKLAEFNLLPSCRLAQKFIGKEIDNSIKNFFL